MSVRLQEKKKKKKKTLVKTSVKNMQRIKIYRKCFF